MGHILNMATRIIRQKPHQATNRSSPQHTDHERCFIASARPHEEAYAEGLLTKALLETLDYTQQLNPWVDHLTLIEQLQIKNQTAPGPQRFLFEKTDKPILLTNKAFDLEADYKNICPFKGLESFDFEKNPDDPLYFKGRTELTEELLEKVQTANFLAVLGASGNGKSSVVRAGLLYELRQRQRWAILPVITPTADPLKALGTLIGMPAAQLSDFIKQAQTERLVLVIDQFEELFTLCKNDAQREQFFELLLTAVEQTDNPFSLIIVMRADFLDKCSHHVELAKKIQAHQIIVTPMTAAELEEAIVAPTQQVGLQIEPKLVSEMLADVKGALGSLPLLQYTLKELWKTCATQRLLTYSAYEKLGKIAGTLEQGANGVYQNLSPAEQKTAQRIFIELTQLGEGSPDTRRQLSQQDLVTALPFESVPVNQVIQKLVAANLVVTDKPKEEQVAIVNIAHEALTQHWGQLRGWLDDNRDAIKIQRDIEANAKKFQDSNQSKSALLQGLNLNIAKDYAKTHTEKVPLSTLALDFVQRSVKRQRDLKWSIRTIVAVVILVLLGAAYYSYVQWTVADEQRVEAENQRQFAQTQQQLANEQRIEADNQRQVAQTQQQLAEDESQRAKQEKDNALRSQSLFLADLAQQETENGNVTNGILLALEALPKDMSNPDKPYVVEAEVQLYEALTKQPTYIELKGHKEEISHATFSPNGHSVLTTSRDNTARLWDVKTGKQFTTLIGHKNDINQAAFSPDGKQIATVSSDGTARLWDANTGEQLSVLIENEDTILHVEFSPDGQRLITGSGRGVLRIGGSTDTNAHLWDPNTGEQIAVLTEHEFGVHDVAFSPDGKRVITTSFDTIPRIWDAKTGKLLTLLKGHKHTVFNAVFSQDGQKIVTASRDATARVWDANTGKQLYVLKHKEFVMHAAISPNGEYIITASDDAFAYLWNTETGEKIFTLAGHSRMGYGMNHTAFSPNGLQVITASSDETARIWDVNTGKQLLVLSGHGAISYTEFSPDGRYLLTEGNNTVRLWDLKSSKQFNQLAVLRGHTKSEVDTSTSFQNDDEMTYAEFSPDGRYIATASYDKTARIWNAETGKQLAVLRHEVFVRRAFFNSDGKRLITSTNDDSTYLWDINTGKKLAVLGSNQSFWDVILSPDRQYVVVGNKLWNLNTSKLVTILTINQEDKVSHIEFSKDGQQVATTSNKTVTIWETSSGKRLTVLIGHDGETTHASFSHDGQYLATASKDNTARLWNVNTGKQLTVFLGHTGEVTSVDFSPNGSYLVTVSATVNDGTARLWNTKTGNKMAIMSKDMWIDNALFTPSGQHVFIKWGKGSSNPIIWNFKTGQQFVVSVLKNYEDTVGHHDEFSPDGQRMIIESILDESPHIWDINTGKPLVTLHEDKLHHVAFGPDQLHYATFSPDGKRVVATYNGIARIWRIFNTQELINYASKIVPRQLTPEQRKQFFVFTDEEGKTQALVDKGKYLAQQGNIESAIAEFKKALMLDSHLDFDPDTKARKIAVDALVNTLMDKASKLEEQDEMDKAITIYTKVSKLAPYHKTVWRAIGNILSKQYKLDEAMAAYKQQVEIDPELEHTWFYMGNILSVQGRFNEAIAAYQNQVAIIPSHELAWYYMGNLLLKHDKFDEAIATYKKVWDKEGKNYYDAQIGIAKALAKKGQSDKAIEYIVAVPVNTIKKGISLTKFLINQKRYNHALEICNQLLSLKPDNIDVLYVHGHLAEKMGLMEQYELDFRRILEINPQHVNALNTLGYTLANRTERYQEAYDLIKRALHLQPDNFAFLDSMGWVLYRMGKYSESLEYLRKAQVKQNAPDVAAHLGEVLWVSGDKDAAKVVWEKALNDFHENEKLREIVQRFMPKRESLNEKLLKYFPDSEKLREVLQRLMLGEKNIGEVRTLSGKSVLDFNVPSKIRKDYELIILMLISESMNDEERQDWFNRTEVMSEEQIEKLTDILRRERRKLLEIDAKYKDK